jgi:tetratricopeptide (TPR) repeat protein
MPTLGKKEIGEITQGKQKVADILGIDAKQIASLLMAGHRLLEQGLLEDAKSIFQGLAVLDRRNAYLQGVLGSIHQRQGDYDAALARYDMALGLFPADVHSLTNRGEIRLKRGDLREAAADFKKAIDLDPDRKHPAANRARLLVNTTQDALEMARQKGVEAGHEVNKQIVNQQSLSERRS